MEDKVIALRLSFPGAFAKERREAVMDDILAIANVVAVYFEAVSVCLLIIVAVGVFRRSRH